MTVRTEAPPPVRPGEAKRIETEVSASSQAVRTSGRLHVLDRDFVLALPAGLRATGTIVNFLFFALFAGLWLVFGALLVVNQSALDTVWQYVIDLPFVLQVVVWILFLPIMVGLWIWESDWALWLRLALDIMVGAGWTAVMFPRPTGKRKAVPDAAPGWHEVPHDTNQ